MAEPSMVLIRNVTGPFAGPDSNAIISQGQSGGSSSQQIVPCGVSTMFVDAGGAGTGLGVVLALGTGVPTTAPAGPCPMIASSVAMVATTPASHPTRRFIDVIPAS